MPPGLPPNYFLALVAHRPRPAATVRHPLGCGRVACPLRASGDPRVCPCLAHSQAGRQRWVHHGGPDASVNSPYPPGIHTAAARRPPLPNSSVTTAYEAAAAWADTLTPETTRYRAPTVWREKLIADGGGGSGSEAGRPATRAATRAQSRQSQGNEGRAPSCTPPRPPSHSAAASVAGRRADDHRRVATTTREEMAAEGLHYGKEQGWPCGRRSGRRHRRRTAGEQHRSSGVFLTKSQAGPCPMQQGCGCRTARPAAVLRDVTRRQCLSHLVTRGQRVKELISQGGSLVRPPSQNASLQPQAPSLSRDP